MSQPDPVPDDPHQDASFAVPEEQAKQIEQLKQIGNAFGTLVEDITPWLAEFGSWLFGGLIAFDLLIIVALITIGPVEPAIIVSGVAFALALPLEVAGLFLLRLDQDLKHVRFEEEVAQAFQEVSFPGSEQVTSSTMFEARRKRRTRVILYYSLAILSLNVILTVTGMSAALWHLTWWIGVAFFAMTLISLGIVITAIANSEPPDSSEEKARKRRSREEMIRQAKEQQRKK